MHKYQCKPSYLLSSEHVGLDESTLEYIFETKYENHFLLFPGSCIDTTENEYVDKRNPPQNQTSFKRKNGSLEILEDKLISIGGIWRKQIINIEGIYLYLRKIKEQHIKFSQLFVGTVFISMLIPFL